MTQPERAWAQQPLEPVEAWGSFTKWLHAKPRPAPLQFGELPAKWDWATRARLFDAFSDGATTSEQQKLSETMVNLLRVVHLEANKLLTQSQLNTGPFISTKDILSILAFLAADKGNLEKLMNNDAEFDMSKVGTDDLKKLQSLLHAVKK